MGCMPEAGLEVSGQLVSDALIILGVPTAHFSLRESIKEQATVLLYLFMSVLWTF